MLKDQPGKSQYRGNIVKILNMKAFIWGFLGLNYDSKKVLTTLQGSMYNYGSLLEESQKKIILKLIHNCKSGRANSPVQYFTGWATGTGEERAYAREKQFFIPIFFRSHDLQLYKNQVTALNNVQKKTDIVKSFLSFCSALFGKQHFCVGCKNLGLGQQIMMHWHYYIEPIFNSIFKIGLKPDL